MKKIFLSMILLIFSISMLTGCFNSSDDSLDKANISLIIMDYSTQKVLKNVDVTLVESSASVISTNDNGVATINGLKVGNYKVLLEKDGYAAMFVSINVALAATRENIVASNNVYTFTMSKNNQKINGFAQLGDTNATMTPCANAKLLISFSTYYEIYKDAYTVTTDANGKFEFLYAPAGTSYTIKPMPIEKNDNVYTAYSVSGNVYDGVVSYANTIAYTKAYSLK